MLRSRYSPDEWMDTSHRSSRLPSAIRRLSANSDTFSSDIGLVADERLWSPDSSGVDDDVPGPRAPCPEWRKQRTLPSRRIPSATRRLSRAPPTSHDDDNTLSSDEQIYSNWNDEEGPPMPAQSSSSSRNRQQQMVAAQTVTEEPPPWWWYPCYHSDPDAPWYEPETIFGKDTYWEPALCADHIYIACKMAVVDAIENQEKQFAKAWQLNLKDLQEMFQDFDYDWMPKVAKKPEKPIDANHHKNSTFEIDMMGCHHNLQVVSVPVDQIIRDQQSNEGEFLPTWQSVKTHLRQVLCEAECGLYHMKIPKREMPRAVMPNSLRDLRGYEQQVRDWIIFRDYKNLMQFYEHVFLRHTIYQ